MAVPDFLQTKTYSTNTAATSHPITLDSAVRTSGGSIAPSTLILTISYDGASGNQVSSVTDTLGSTWVQGATASDSTSVNGEMWYALNVTGGAAPTITCSMASSVKASIVAVEIDQVRPVSSLDYVQNRIDTTISATRASAALGAGTRNGMISVFVGGLALNHATLTVSAAGTGWTELTSIKDGSSNIGAAMIRRSAEQNSLAYNTSRSLFTMSTSSTTPCAVMSLTFMRDGVITSNSNDGWINNTEGVQTIDATSTSGFVYMSSASAPNGGTGGSAKDNSYYFFPDYSSYLLSGVTLNSTFTLTLRLNSAYDDGSGWFAPVAHFYINGGIGSTVTAGDEPLPAADKQHSMSTAILSLTGGGGHSETLNTSEAFNSSGTTALGLSMEGDGFGATTSSYYEPLMREINITSYLTLSLNYPSGAPNRTLMGVGL